MVTNSIIGTGTKCRDVVACITIYTLVLSLVTVKVRGPSGFCSLSVWGLHDVITITNICTSTCANYVNVKCANLFICHCLSVGVRM